MARRWRRRPIPAPGISLCLVCAMHRDLGMDFAVGRDRRPMRRRGEVQPTRGPGKSGGKTTLPIYSESRPNQYMQAFFGERCLEPGNPNRRSPKISDPRVGPVCAMHRELRSDGGEIEAGDVGCREAGRARPPCVKSRKNDRVFSSLRKRKNFEIFPTAFLVIGKDVVAYIIVFFLIQG